MDNRVNLNNIFEVATYHISQRDKKLAKVISHYGLLTLKPSDNYFISLSSSIIGQQLSTSAASSIKKRFRLLFNSKQITPGMVLKKRNTTLHKIGMSKAKTMFIKELAKSFNSNILNDVILNSDNFDDVNEILLSHKGIGPWTIDMFRIFSLNHLDVFPKSDAGVLKGMRLLYNWDGEMNEKLIKHKSSKWSPYRSIASLYFWKIVDEGLPPSLSKLKKTFRNQD